jgi:hypothetical protein
MEPTRVSKKTFESMYQIVLGMSNQFLTTRLSRIVRLSCPRWEPEGRRWRLPECRRPEISRSAKQLFRCEARKLVGDHEGRSSGKYVLRPAEGLCVKLPLLSMVDRGGSIVLVVECVILTEWCQAAAEQVQW